MVETIEYMGKVYRRYPESKRRSDRVYFKRSVTGGAVWLHRQIWADARGPIPVGAHIHHVNEDPNDNSIDNLACISPAEHGKAHEWSDERRARQAVHLERIRPLTKTWHASPEGIAKHREIGGMAYKVFVPVEKACGFCGGLFATKKIGHQDRFCSNKCKSAARRASGIDDVERICEACGLVFVANKYKRQRFCCRACAVRRP